jgi:hypothetical protein
VDGPVERITYYEVPKDSKRYMDWTVFRPLLSDINYLNLDGTGERTPKKGPEEKFRSRRPRLQTKTARVFRRLVGQRNDDGHFHGSASDMAGETPWPGSIDVSQIPPCIRTVCNVPDMLACECDGAFESLDDVNLACECDSANINPNGGQLMTV